MNETTFEQVTIDNALCTCYNIAKHGLVLNVMIKKKQPVTRDLLSIVSSNYDALDLMHCCETLYIPLLA